MSEQVICLSDSESDRSTTNEEVPIARKNSYEDIDFSFPPVEFTYHVNQPTSVINKNNDKDIEKATIIRTPEILDEYCVSKQISDNDRKRKGASRTNVETRAEQIAKEKALKAIERKNLKKIQPGECLKSMQVLLDRQLENCGFLLHIVDALVNSDISWKLEALPISDSIMWIRETEELCTSDSNNSCNKENYEKQIIIIWNCDKIVDKVKDRSFVSTIENSLNYVPDLRPTLILYGMEEYFCYNKKGGKENSTKKNLPKISRQDLEICLAEIQLALNCDSQFVDTHEDLGSLVYRFTKSIAEIPYKLEKRQKLAEKLDWYVSGDNRDTVRVDNSGNGLKRLWQQQLCQFNLASLETAEAISAVYPSPIQLMEAYQNCASNEGEILLKDIAIRRAAGHLSTVRKIGPELSKKIFIMFTSKDGDAILGNEKE